MFSIWKIAVPAIIVAAVVIVWIGGVSMKKVKAPKAEREVVAEEPKSAATIVSDRDSSDASLDLDVSLVDKDLEVFDSGSSAVDEGLNDEPVSQIQ